MKSTKFQIPYPQEFKDELVERMLPPESIDPKELAIESGVSITSLKNWLKEAESVKSSNIKEQKIKWIPVDVINTPKKEFEEKINPIKVKIGAITIEIESGFNKQLLLDLMRVVTEI